MAVEFNINHTVKVKLTPVGITELKRQHDELSEFVPLSDFETPKTDEEGYSTFQLWSLMNSFGHMMINGGELPFDPTIKLEELEKER